MDGEPHEMRLDETPQSIWLKNGWIWLDFNYYLKKNAHDIGEPHPKYGCMSEHVPEITNLHRYCKPGAASVFRLVDMSSLASLSPTV